MAEYQHVNDALRQSQKMEAIGQLTGGLAHDFNNLLHVVIGNLEMLLRHLPVDDARSRRAADNAMSGAQRAATLTQRLLAFARRQPLAPKPIGANQLVEGMTDLMQRTLGEKVSVKLNLASDLWPVEADPNQLENALLNLAVNARDAMDQGGVLTISTANCVVGERDAQDDAVPGEYVTLAVCDTGSGMTSETLARVLEPFFTTKDVGKGTGLGLSMGYGFAKQSGGHLSIESSLGRGTAVTVYLPRHVGDPGADLVIGRETEIAPPGSGEVILVVEADTDLRAHTCEVLEELGYHARPVIDGVSALEALRSSEPIDLVFADVVLAGPLAGRDIAEHVNLLRPSLPVLLTSGYAPEAIIKIGPVEGRTALLPKPFTISQLASKIRKLLHQPLE